MAQAMGDDTGQMPEPRRGETLIAGFATHGWRASVRSPTVREGDARDSRLSASTQEYSPVFLNQDCSRVLPSLTVGLLTLTANAVGYRSFAAPRLSSSSARRSGRMWGKRITSRIDCLFASSIT